MRHLAYFVRPFCQQTANLFPLRVRVPFRLTQKPGRRIARRFAPRTCLFLARLFPDLRRFPAKLPRLFLQQSRAFPDSPAVHDEIGEIEEPVLRRSERWNDEVDLVCPIASLGIGKENNGSQSSRA